MRVGSVTKALVGGRGGGWLTRGDVDAVVWARLKSAKAPRVYPNLWDIRMSPSDSRQAGIDRLGDTAFESVRSAMAGEGLDTGSQMARLEASPSTLEDNDMLYFGDSGVAAVTFCAKPIRRER